MELNNILKKLSLVILILFGVSFSACSSKKVFEPKKVQGEWNGRGDINESIIDSSSNIAELQNHKVISKRGLRTIVLPKGYRVLTSNNGSILSTNLDGNLTITQIKNPDINTTLELKKTIATASVQDDIVAVIFADNEIALYSLSSRKLLFNEKGGNEIALDSRITPPYFMKDLVLFLTLDGKVVIVNSRLKKRLRTVIVSSALNFNNIIYFNIVDKKLISATPYKILSLSKDEKRAKYEIRDVVDDGQTIFITTKQGEIISLNSSLDLKTKVKFPFAHFLGMVIAHNKLYVLEKEGYLIEISKDLLTYKIYDVDIDNDSFFIGKDRFYMGDEYISLDKKD